MLKLTQEVRVGSLYAILTIGRLDQVWIRHYISLISSLRLLDIMKKANCLVSERCWYWESCTTVDTVSLVVGLKPYRAK